ASMLQKISKVNALTLLFKVEFAGERWGGLSTASMLQKVSEEHTIPPITKLEILERVEGCGASTGSIHAAKDF
uniref:hypothetical protein n=1 Tax=Alteromonas stellipolaris TaxID=233316 RepID=UPI003563614C